MRVAGLYARLVDDEALRERMLTKVTSEFDRTCTAILAVVDLGADPRRQAVPPDVDPAPQPLRRPAPRHPDPPAAPVPGRDGSRPPRRHRPPPDADHLGHRGRPAEHGVVWASPRAAAAVRVLVILAGVVLTAAAAVALAGAVGRLNPRPRGGDQNSGRPRLAQVGDCAPRGRRDGADRLDTAERVRQQGGLERDAAVGTPVEVAGGARGDHDRPQVRAVGPDRHDRRRLAARPAEADRGRDPRAVPTPGQRPDTPVQAPSRRDAAPEPLPVVRGALDAGVTVRRRAPFTGATTMRPRTTSATCRPSGRAVRPRRRRPASAIRRRGPPARGPTTTSFARSTRRVERSGARPRPSAALRPVEDVVEGLGTHPDARPVRAAPAGGHEHGPHHPVPEHAEDHGAAVGRQAGGLDRAGDRGEHARPPPAGATARRLVRTRDCLPAPTVSRTISRRPSRRTPASRSEHDPPGGARHGRAPATVTSARRASAGGRARAGAAGQREARAERHVARHDQSQRFPVAVAHAPPQPRKVARGSGVAVSCTAVPSGIAASHCGGQKAVPETP